MAVTLDFQKLPAGGNVAVWVALKSTVPFANPKNPTVAEMNALHNASRSISWNDYDFGVQASNTTSDPALSDASNVQDLGAEQYGGSISFYFPNTFDDSSNWYSLTYDLVGGNRPSLYIVTRVDGSKPSYSAVAAGDLLSVHEVQADSFSPSLTGEEAFRYTRNMIASGFMSQYVVANTGTATLAVQATLAITVAAQPVRITATVNGREYRNGLVWTTSDATKATVTEAGVIDGIAAGTATITATYPPTGASATCAVTVS